jgi:hypothetical protein
MGTTAQRVVSEEGDDPIDLASSSNDHSLLASSSSHDIHDEEGSFLEQVELHAQAEPTHDFKKVKVYELRNEAWFDRGTGHVHGLYDEDTDQALLVVTAEHVPLSEEERLKEEEKRAKMEVDVADQGGGFLLPDEEDKDAGLGELPVIKGIRSKGVEGRVIMHSLVQAKDVYQRQQGQLVFLFLSYGSFVCSWERRLTRLNLVPSARYPHRLDGAKRNRHRSFLCRSRRL